MRPGPLPLFVAALAAACGPAVDSVDGAQDGRRTDVVADAPDREPADAEPPADDGPPTRREDDPTRCTNGVDDDGDGWMDCVDFDCDGQGPCGRQEEGDLCSNGVDDDGDGDRDCADDECADATPCTPTTLRAATWNLQRLSDTPNGFAVARDFLARMGADVVCLNEIDVDEALALADLAAAAAYPHVFQGEAPAPPAYDLTNAVLSRLPVVEATSLSSADVSTDPDANELVRDLVVARVEVAPGVAYASVVCAHFKAGTDGADAFRRQVEALRTAAVVADLRARHPDEPVVVLGDLNETLGEEPAKSFASVPSGVPAAYALGDDVALPVDYAPLATLQRVGVELAPAVHEDSTATATRISSGRRVDYVAAVGTTAAAAIVYDPCADDGVDAEPAGAYLPLVADALIPACGAAEEASDHRPVVADLLLP